MRISDWSSDVCSSDLNFPPADVAPAEAAGPADAVDGTIGGCLRLSHRRPQRGDVEYAAAVGDDPPFGIAGSAGVKDHGSRPGGRIQSFYHRALGGFPRIAWRRHHHGPRRLVPPLRDRNSVVSGKSWSVRVDLGGGRLITKNK